MPATGQAQEVLAGELRRLLGLGEMVGGLGGMLLKAAGIAGKAEGVWSTVDHTDRQSQQAQPEKA